MMSAKSGTIGVTFLLEQDFLKTRKRFLEENYPNLQSGMHTHPGMFLQSYNPEEVSAVGNESEEEKLNLCEMAVYNFLKKQFEKYNCFLFHSFRNGIDHKVVEQYCKRLETGLDLGTNTVQEVEKKLSGIAKLSFIKLKRIIQSPNTRH